MNNKIPVIILGGSGYVGGELLRLLSFNPNFYVDLVISDSQEGKLIAEVFPHLKNILPSKKFISLSLGLEKLNNNNHWVVISAANHGKSAHSINKIISKSKKKKIKINIIDIAADFRFDNKSYFEDTYNQKHSAPEIIESFYCGIPEQLKKINKKNIAHPGCFATSMLLSIMPLVENNITELEFSTSAVTGSTGSGSQPKLNTHHPIRDSNFFAYNPLKHRHSIEVIHLIKKITKKEISLNFVPHSGPFTRGIHATTFCKLKDGYDDIMINKIFSDYYKNNHFIDVVNAPPKMKDIVGTNNAQIYISTNHNYLVIFCVIDNLINGAAGGAIQLANKLIGCAEEDGLKIPPIGWA